MQEDTLLVSPLGATEMEQDSNENSSVGEQEEAEADRGGRGEADGKIFPPIDIESRALGQEYLALLQSRRPRWLVGRGTAGRWGGCPAATCGR